MGKRILEVAQLHIEYGSGCDNGLAYDEGEGAGEEAACAFN